MVGRDSPNGATAQVEMVHPTNPDMICFEMNVPELLGKEAFVMGFEIKEAKTSFCLRHVNRFLGNQRRSTSPNITSP